MRILLAGATGALGRRLLPKLVDAGHEVVGTTRSPEKLSLLEAAGAQGVVMNGLDRDSVAHAVAGVEPEVVIHQLTALSTVGNLKKFDQEFAETNRLRTTGTDHLMTASQAAGAQRFIAQSYTGWPNERSGDRIKDETSPLDTTPTAASARTLDAIRYLEDRVTSASDMAGLVLRYGSFYGPGTGLGKRGDLLEMVAKRRLPIVGGGAGVWSFCHIDDAASATVAAVTNGAPGIYNIVDDEPSEVADWLPYLADAIGAKPPMRLPAWLAKPMIGEHGISMMTQVRGSSNAKAKAELGWSPTYPSWRDGFRTGLG
jgi:2-alkyl-3-oxoalkanoate reductase